MDVWHVRDYVGENIGDAWRLLKHLLSSLHAYSELESQFSPCSGLNFLTM